MSPKISRRVLANGVTWAVPAVLASAVTPVYAASACAPNLTYSGGASYGWGAENGTTTNQFLTLGGQVTVNDLPLGVTVTSIKQHFVFEQRANSTVYGPGAIFIADSSSNYGSNGSCVATSCSVPWAALPGGGYSKTSTAPRNGYSDTVVNTYSNRNVPFPDGVSRLAWDLTLAWSVSDAYPGTYTSTANGCQKFAPGQSGRFEIDYTNVAAPPGSATQYPDAVVRSFVLLTVVLSNGQTLQASSNLSVNSAP